jgi:hypothetical protein
MKRPPDPPDDDLADRRWPTMTFRVFGEPVFTDTLPIGWTPRAPVGRKAVREYLAQRKRRRLRVIEGGAGNSGPEPGTDNDTEPE